MLLGLLYSSPKDLSFVRKKNIFFVIVGFFSTILKTKKGGGYVPHVIGVATFIKRFFDKKHSFLGTDAFFRTITLFRVASPPPIKLNQR